MLRLNDRAQAVLYIVLVLGGAVGVVVMSWYRLLMFVPTLAALVMMLLIGRDGYTRNGWRRLGLGRAGVRAWAAAVLLPIAALGSGYLAAVATGLATYAPLPGMSGLSLILNYLVLVAFYTFTFSLGEELGWRGYLVPRLMAFGRMRGHLIGGLAWAAFHYPVMFLSDLYLAEGNPVLNVLSFTLMVLILSVVMGELRLSTGSVWPISLMHSAHNALNELVGQGLQVTAPLGLYLVGETGLATIVVYLAAALWLLRMRRSRPALNVRRAA